MPEVKVEVEPISVPITLPFSGKKEPLGDTASAIVESNEKRKYREISEARAK